MVFRTLHRILGKVIIDVVNEKHYVNNINCKYNVTMATSPPRGRYRTWRGGGYEAAQQLRFRMKRRKVARKLCHHTSAFK